MTKDKTNAYHQHQKSSLSANGNSRETDARALLTAAMRLETAKNEAAATQKSKAAMTQLADAIRYNQKIWTIFQVAAHDPSNPLDDELRGLLISLARFVDQVSFRIIGHFMPEEIDSLIGINRTLATGLSKTPTGEAVALPVIDTTVNPLSLMTSA